MGNKHQYETFYKMSPWLYDRAYIFKNRMLTVIYKVKNRKYIIKPSVDSEYTNEFEHIIKNVGEFNPNTSTGISPSAAAYLYSLVRELKPEIFLETGVSHGLSSLIILEAMEKNSKGMLFSAEISNDVGDLIPLRLRKRWQLIVDAPDKVLEKAIKTIKRDQIDMFMHDSDHSYVSMTNEFNAIKSHMSINGLVLSDDIEENNAFMDFALSVNVEPKIIASYKCFGIIQLSKYKN